MSRFEKKNEEPLEDWLLSYADMITLVMAFFIILVSMSKIDANKYEEVQSGMARDIGNREVTKPLQDLRSELLGAVAGAGVDEAIDIGRDDRGVVLNLASGAMFQPGSADIRPEFRPVMKEITTTLGQPRFTGYQIEIQGHTDDVPVRTPQFPSNWDLSAGRALATLKLMNEQGLDAARMKISAYADTAPRVPNHSETGRAYPENQAINRRVQIHVYPR
ncbi:OmpA/MotB family protein [Magnetospirillum molischianum]|uniref:Flagellar motor protein n=1 Tax=Magnetospirillum molischianum DSM 120 TaxID=1150626 RepID=H8FXA1_MAGML|nr:flagellar motor protein MotB [Magnetospirillum molischianum]CCG42989.1 Flagellar motor protein [Magnetospirillum molischianum DSM 120]